MVRGGVCRRGARLDECSSHMRGHRFTGFALCADRGSAFFSRTRGRFAKIELRRWVSGRARFQTERPACCKARMRRATRTRPALGTPRRAQVRSSIFTVGLRAGVPRSYL